MHLKDVNLSPNDIIQFKNYLSQQIKIHRKKLTGDEMAKLKRTQFQEYIKKIKYYARKDLDKIKQSNLKIFYANNPFFNYDNRQEPTATIKKEKPFVSPQKKQISHYYFGKAELSSMKEFIFLVEQCHRIQKNLNKMVERRRNSEFIRNIEHMVQKVNNFQASPKKEQKLHLTLKSAHKIQESMRSKKLMNPQKRDQKTKQSFEKLFKKSFESTNFTQRRANSLASLGSSIIKRSNHQ